MGLRISRLPQSLLVVAAAAALGISLSRSAARMPEATRAEPAGPSAGFKITFGLKQKGRGRDFSGGMRDALQVRSVRGWHLAASDSLTPPARWSLTLAAAGPDTPAKGLIVEVAGPEQQPVELLAGGTAFSFVPARIPYGVTHFPEPFQGDVAVERVPLSALVTNAASEDDDPALLRTRAGEFWLAWVAYQTYARKGYYYDGGDRIMVARSADGRRWSEPLALTDPGDHFRVALGEDRRGRIWCVYGLQKKLETGDFNLFAKVFDGRRWSDEQPLTRHPLPDIFHRLAADGAGNLFLVWMGFRAGPRGTVAQSDILMRVHTGERWGEEINVSQSAEDDWFPAVAAGSAGRAYIAWDSYRATGGGPANYDLMLREYAAGRLGPARAVSQTPYAEMNADVVVDAEDRLWVAWEEGDVNWGKDSGYQNPKHGIYLRQDGARLYGLVNSRTARYRRPRLAVLEGGRWKQPAAELARCYPEFLQPNLFQSPRLGRDAAGRVWLFLRHQVAARGRNAGHMFDYYATTLAGRGAAQRWLAPILLPASTGRQDTVLASAPASGGIAVAVVGDGRHYPVALPINHDVSTLVLEAGGLEAAPPELEPFQPSLPPAFSVTHPEELRQIAAVRSHRVRAAGQTFKIVRGDVHRHTEISADGGADGALWDFYRYALDAAALDFAAVTDHNYGAWIDTDEPEGRNTDDEYQWWRTQKSADLFHLPGRFVPLYGYERSINFPLGHRNIFHERRGVFSYRVPKLNIGQRPELIEKDAQGLWAYLRETRGLGIAHTSGTTMGTDWRLRDDQLEPVTEIYQGCRNAYEDEGSPRAALPSAPGDGRGGVQPFQKGLIWNALGAGYRMGFIASSDHFSTHISYANLLVPDRLTTRADLQAAFRARRTYASTDNLVLDFRAGNVLQGAEMRASASPVFQVYVLGTEPLLKVEVIKNNRILYTRAVAPGRREASFSFRDTAQFGGNFADTSMGPTSQIKDWSRPETGIRPRPPDAPSYYYVRVVQRYSAAEPEREGEVAWSSPIFVGR